MTTKLPSLSMLAVTRRQALKMSASSSSSFGLALLSHRRLVHQSIFPAMMAATTSAAAAAKRDERTNNKTPRYTTTTTTTPSHNNNDFPCYPSLQVSANSATAESEWAEEITMMMHLQNTMNNKTDKTITQRRQLQQRQEDLLAALQRQQADNNANAVDTCRPSVEQRQPLLLSPQLAVVSSPESAIGYTHVAETLDEDARHDLAASLLHNHSNKTGQDDDSTMTPQQVPTEAVKEQAVEPQQHHQAAEDDDDVVKRMMQRWQLEAPETALGIRHVAEMLTDSERRELQSILAKQGKALPSVLPEEEENDEYSMDLDRLVQRQLLRSSPESATGDVHIAETLTATEQEQLTALILRHESSQQPKQQQQPLLHVLPTTYQQALQEENDKWADRAMVITTAEPPFRVVHVNEAWTGLCGFTQEEAYHQPIGKLLRGPETQAGAARQLVQQVLLLSSSSSSPSPSSNRSLNLINYTKTGRKFYNHLQVGPLFSSSSSSKEDSSSSAKVEYLIGILEEIQQHDTTNEEKKKKRRTAV